MSNASPTNASGHDLAALQGVWEQVALESDGEIDPPDDDHGAPGALTTISGNTFSVRTRQGEILLKGSFTLDASTTPRSITWVDDIGVDQGKHLPASYELEGDHFVFIAANEGAARPIRFSTVPGLTMRTFRRK